MDLKKLIIEELVTDVDGVLTDGKYFYSDQGKILKQFGPHDSDGFKIIKSLGIKYFKVDGNNISEVYDKSLKAIDYIRQSSRPVFIEFITYRWLEHCGPFYDVEQGRNYRKNDEVEHWKKACPVNNYKKKLIKKLSLKKILYIENSVKKIVDNSYLKATKAKYPTKKDLYKNV